VYFIHVASDVKSNHFRSESPPRFWSATSTGQAPLRYTVIDHNVNKAAT